MIRSIALIATRKPNAGFSVSLSQNTISVSGGTSSLTTGTVTASASGGTAPYTYAWSNSGGDSATASTNAAGASSSFRRTSCVSGNTYDSTFICTVTDATSATAASGALQVSITRT